MKSNTFRNNLIIILLCMVVPMLIVLLIEYRLMGKEIIGQAQNNENRMLEECTEKYDASIQSIRRVSAQLMEYFGQGGKENAFLEKNLDDKLRILNDFSVLQDNEVIQSYYVFYLNENRMIINGSFYDPSYIKDQDFFLFPEIKEGAACNIWKPEREYCEEANKKTVKTVAWLRSFPIGEAEPEGYIAINVDFRKLISLFFVSEAREYSIRTVQGETLFTTGEYNSEDYLIFSDESEEMEWVYENAVEEKNLLMSLETIKRIMSVVCAAGILGCIVISLVTSQFIYRPMQELLHFIKVEKKKGKNNEYELIKKKFIQNEHERMDMEEKNRRLEPVYYENLIRSLLTDQHLSETEKNDDSLFIHAASCYQVVVFYDYQMRMQENGLWKAIKAIIQSEIDISLKLTGTQIQKNIAAIVFYSEDKEDMVEKIMQFAAQMQSAIMHKNAVSVSAGISRSCEAYDKFPEMYTQALEATYFHIYYEDQRPVLYDDICRREEEKQDNVEKYPISIERKILGGLRGQQLAVTMEQTEEFFRIIQERRPPAGVVKMWVNTLKFSILSLAEHTGIDLWEEVDTLELCRDIDVNWFNSIEDLKKFIERYLQAYLNILNGSTEDKHKELVEVIKKYVVDHVSEDISLSVVADRYKVSVPYLSTIFKKQTGENFVKFLIEVKMAFAAELLLETKMTVSDIAEKTGYTSLNSFSNAFKKYYGTTPSKYRFEKIKDEK